MPEIEEKTPFEILSEIVKSYAYKEVAGRLNTLEAKFVADKEAFTLVQGVVNCMGFLDGYIDRKQKQIEVLNAPPMTLPPIPIIAPPTPPEAPEAPEE